MVFSSVLTTDSRRVFSVNTYPAISTPLIPLFNRSGNRGSLSIQRDRHRNDYRHSISSLAKAIVSRNKEPVNPLCRNRSRQKRHAMIQHQRRMQRQSLAIPRRAGVSWVNRNCVGAIFRPVAGKGVLPNMTHPLSLCITSFRWQVGIPSSFEVPTMIQRHGELVRMDQTLETTSSLQGIIEKHDAFPPNGTALFPTHSSGEKQASCSDIDPTPWCDHAPQWRLWSRLQESNPFVHN